MSHHGRVPRVRGAVGEDRVQPLQHLVQAGVAEVVHQSFQERATPTNAPVAVPDVAGAVTVVVIGGTTVVAPLPCRAVMSSVRLTATGLLLALAVSSPLLSGIGFRLGRNGLGYGG